jgi:hypothetical protein
MTLRNYVYISKNKLETYYPQISGSAPVELTGKASLNLGVLKAELGAAGSTASKTDHDRLEAVLRYLRERNLVGTIDEPKSFFEGQFEGRSIIHGRMVFFGGFRKLEGKRSWLGLTCSLDNMIGYGYADLPNYSTTGIGPTSSEHFVPTSASLGFARTLQRIWEKEKLFEDSEFDPAAELRRRQEEHQLAPEEQELVKSHAVLNGLIHFVHPAGFLEHWIRELILTPFFDPIMWCVFGKRRYRGKVAALKRQKEIAKLDVDSLLSQEELELLSAIKSAAGSLEAPPQRYEFFAMRLLRGEIDGQPILLGSPFYIGAVFGGQRNDQSSW